jgi:signal transduction histidine kinase/CheY-like chemotaxis protein
MIYSFHEIEESKKASVQIIPMDNSPGHFLNSGRSKATLNRENSVIQEESSDELDNDSIPDKQMSEKDKAGINLTEMPTSTLNNLVSNLRNADDARPNSTFDIIRTKSPYQRPPKACTMSVNLASFRKFFPSGKDLIMGGVAKNFIAESARPNRILKKGTTPGIDRSTEISPGFAGYLNTTLKGPRAKNSQPTENSIIESILRNILGNIDTGIILLDSKLDGVYTNIESVFTNETLSYSHLRELIDIGLLTENGIYNFKRIFMKDKVKE